MSIHVPTVSQYVIVFFLLGFPQKKKSALFEVAEVVPVMTNNYEENILRGVRESTYSLESSIDLLQKDVVQLHAPRYQSMRRVSPDTHTSHTHCGDAFFHAVQPPWQMNQITVVNDDAFWAACV